MNQNKGSSFFLAFLALIMTMGSVKAGESAYYALLIGVNEYKDPTILSLTSPRNDAKTIGGILDRSGWDIVTMMTDDQDIRSKERLFPDKDNIEYRTDLLADMMTPDDVLFIFFSGHGVRSSQGEALLLPFDANRERLSESAVSVEWIKGRFLAKGISRVFLALDACRENMSSAKGLTVVGIGSQGRASQAGAERDYPILYSTQSGGFSYETADGPEAISLFARFIAAGLKAPSTDTEQRNLTWEGLCASVKRDATKYALEKGINQRPDFYLPSGTDIRTVFIRADKAKAGAWNNTTYGGIGMSMLKTSDAFLVNIILPLGPADMAGLQRGDRILAINGMDADLYSMEQFTEKVRGLTGTRLLLKVQKQNNGSILNFPITRSTIVIPSISLQEAEKNRPSVIAIYQAPSVLAYHKETQKFQIASYLKKNATDWILCRLDLDWEIRPQLSKIKDFSFLWQGPDGKAQKMDPYVKDAGYTREADDGMVLCSLFDGGKPYALPVGEYSVDVLYKGKKLCSASFWIVE